MSIDNTIDEMLSRFASAGTAIGGDEQSASSDAVRWCQYKSHSSSGNKGEEEQVQRREKVLREQNRLRNSKLAELRNLKNKQQDNDPKETNQPIDDNFMQISKEVETVPPSVRTSRRRYQRYGEDLDLLQPMLSEWMLSVPTDLATEWMLLFCPVGRRNMVVSKGGTTRVFSKTGKQVMQFSSVLPAGGCDRTNTTDAVTVMDCIFSQADLTFYVLDLLVWNGMVLADTDTECRQFFLRSRFAENSELDQRGVHNSGYRFILAPLIEDCTPAVISKALDEQPSAPTIDGLLFYHRRCNYTHGVTPTVLWLRPFMLPTTLGVPVPLQLTATVVAKGDAV